MVLENKLNITSSAELHDVEEKLTKKKAALLFQHPLLKSLPVGSFEQLRAIHHFLFEDLYDFAGQVRIVDMSKGNFRFASVTYIHQAIEQVSKLPQDNFDNIIEKYVEMNVIHPFREGNGRSMRIWLDEILSKEIGQVVNWSQVDKEDYLLAMERSPIRDKEIKALLKEALVPNSEQTPSFYMKGIDQSYAYEGYTTYKTEEL